MRILHVDTARGWRGGQNQVLLTAKGMERRGHEVIVACRTASALRDRARAADLDVQEVAFGGDLVPAPALALRRLVRRLRPDVVHLHDPHAAAAALLVAPSTSRLVASRRVDFALRGPLSRWKYRRCRRVIAVSRAVARVLEEGGLSAAHVRVVYEGVPDRSPTAGGEDALRALGVPAGVPVVGNVAALTAHKDHATLLLAAAQVIARVPQARFVIVGQGELESRLRTRAHELGLDGHVLFAGFRPDVDRLIPAFDVFCLSSHMEGLGTSLLDAMCYARAVVGTAAGGIPEAVEDGVTGRVVRPRRPDALAEALTEVLLDRARRESMGAAGRARFLERFTADRMVEETLAVYAEAA
ncbi:MAG: glycosyl transferase [Acidobacteria bacterium]|nr:MAG: glycosyl transferase [Acidobacteriota bacterium]